METVRVGVWDGATARAAVLLALARRGGGDWRRFAAETLDLPPADVIQRYAYDYGVLVSHGRDDRVEDLHLLAEAAVLDLRLLLLDR